ncbi:MAG: MbcA/ParS/Xre antitoxin family protein [Kangiellaceae bacterium]|nr:MbcA/ParS/Xre antitoxin family protein [Kangiellaceae bacterium]
MHAQIESNQSTTHDMLVQAGLQFFFSLADKWLLNVEQQRILLGGIPESTYHKLKKTGTGNLSADQLDRISYLMGIFKDLNILLPSEKAANEWVNKPNLAPLFCGQTALERMLSGKIIDLAQIRQYLDAERGA